jgi:hypothetical protein
MSSYLMEAKRLRDISRTHSNGITRKIARKIMRSRAKSYVLMHRLEELVTP